MAMIFFLVFLPKESIEPSAGSIMKIGKKRRKKKNYNHSGQENTENISNRRRQFQ